jgi:nucleoside-diphosphate-sugar epimerase
MPTAANPPTGREFIQMAAQQFGVKPDYRLLGRRMIKFAGWFDSDIRESYELLYQNDSAYLFDSTKFENTFGFKPTTYVEGIAGTAQSCKPGAGPENEGRYEHP